MVAGSSHAAPNRWVISRSWVRAGRADNGAGASLASTWPGGGVVDISATRRDGHSIKPAACKDDSSLQHCRHSFEATAMGVAGLNSGQLPLVPWPGSVVLWPLLAACGSVNTIGTAGGQTKR